MHRLTLLAVSLMLVTPAFAIEPGAGATAAPAADKVYPPLPSLAMLPPASGNEEPAVPRTGHAGRARLKAALPVQEHKSFAPVVRLVVSDTSRAYLDTVGRQLDQALQQSSAPGPLNDRRPHLAGEGINRVR